MMADEKRLIDSNKIPYRKSGFPKGDGCDSGLDWAFREDIDKLPTVDAVEVVHGRWEKAHITGYLKCNSCKDAFIYEEWLESGKWNYCPNCGAKMDGGTDNV
jgi:hypothetical protein